MGRGLMPWGCQWFRTVSGNEFERSELASAAGVSRCSQVGPEGPWQTRVEGQFWLGGNSKDSVCPYSKTNVQTRVRGSWDLSLSKQRGRDPRRNTPGWAQLGVGLAVLCLYFALACSLYLPPRE